MKSIALIWKQNKRTIGSIVALALLLRLLVLGVTAPYVEELNDQKIFEIATEYFFEGKDLYATNIEQVESPFRTQLIRNYPYGPLPTWIFAFLTVLGGVIHAKFAILLRLLHIGIDVLLTFLIFVAATRLGKNAKLLAWLYALNPLTIIITSYHGQLDVLTIFFSFLAGYVLLFSKHKQKHVISGILLGISIATKMFTVILWPWFVKSIDGWKKRIVFTLLAGLPFLVSLLTVLTPENMGRAIRQVLLYGGAGAENGIILTLHALSSLTSLDTFTTLASLYHSVGKYVLLLALGVAFVHHWRRLQLIDGLTLFFLITMIFAPTMGVQYFVWFLPFYLLSSFFRRNLFLVQLSILTITMGLFYFYHGVGIGVFAGMGITPAMKPLFLTLFNVFMWIAWVGFVWMTVDAIWMARAATQKEQKER